MVCCCREKGGAGWSTLRARWMVCFSGISLSCKVPVRLVAPARSAANTNHRSRKSESPEGVTLGTLSVLANWSEFPPAVAPPITAALVLAPPEMLARAPPPVVTMHDHAGIRRIAVPLLGMPAHVVITDDRSRRTHRGEGQHAGPHHEAESSFPQRCHLQTPVVLVLRSQRGTQNAVPADARFQ